MYIKIENLSKKYSDKILFSGVNLMFTDSHRVGLVGKNGTGKTTFLKILIKEIKADKGNILIDPPKSKIIYHAQVLENENELREDDLNEEETLDPNTVSETMGSSTLALNPPEIPTTCFEYLLSQTKELYTLWKSINLNNNENIPVEDINEWVNEYTLRNGYEFEDKIVKALKRLKLEPDQKVSTLSGGQKTRLQFGKLLIEEHDILLLDEPTNHLDIEGIEWFYNYLENYKGIVIIATHDRNLLTKSINKIVEFEDNKLAEYSGNYEFYKKKKLEIRISTESKIRANEKRVEQLNEAAKELEMRLKRHETRAKEMQKANLREVRLSKKNKTAKTKIIKQKLNLYRDNDKLTRNFKLDRQAVKFKSARSNLLTKADRVDVTRSKIGWNMKIDFNTPEIESDFVLRIKDLSKSFGEKKVLENFSLDLMKNEKVALIGPNGTGKTTILKCIAQEIQDYTGEIDVSNSIKAGYLEQDSKSLNFERTVLNEFLSVAKHLSESEARSFLHFFLFEGEQPLRQVKTLSEGEKLKLKLAKLLYSNHNFLLLDEPTNHLDIASQEVIEKALRDFEGSILLVTHDEMLIKGIGVNKVVEL